jgi:hypothetical protein
MNSNEDGVVSLDLLAELKQRGFGIGVNGLKHDGKLFSSKKIFDERAPQKSRLDARTGHGLLRFNL